MQWRNAVIPYRIIDYLGDLTISQIDSATPLTFVQYVPPINGVGTMLEWDFKAFFSATIDSTNSRNMFAFEGTVGATYDILSESFFDPFVLQLFDHQGKGIAKDDGSGIYGMDHIKFTAPYDGIYYVDASWRQGFTDIDQYTSLSVYEDLDTIPPLSTRSSPIVSVFSPANAATGVSVDSNIVLVFNEAIQRGSGSISIKTAENILIESFDARASNNLFISGNTLIINPTNNLSNNTQFFVTLDSGAIKDLAGNSSSEIKSYSFTTLSPIPDTTPSIDRIFNWGENKYPDLFSNHPESQDIFGYYARIYSNGNAIGEQNENIYFYDGGKDGTKDTVLIGTIADFLPLALSAGF